MVCVPEESRYNLDSSKNFSMQEFQNMKFCCTSCLGRDMINDTDSDSLNEISNLIIENKDKSEKKKKDKSVEIKESSICIEEINFEE